MGCLLSQLPGSRVVGSAESRGPSLHLHIGPSLGKPCAQACAERGGGGRALDGVFSAPQERRAPEASAAAEAAAAMPPPPAAAEAAAARRRALWEAWLPLALWAAAPAALLLAGGSLVSSWRGGLALASLAFVILGWAVRPEGAPIEYTSLAFLTLVSASQLLSWAEAWEGLASEGVWLIFCGMALSAGLTETRVCDWVASRLCAGRPSPLRLLARLHLTGAALAVFVPSQVVRVQLVVPIARQILTECSLEPRSWPAAAVVMSLVVSTNHCGVAVLTGSVPNLIAMGALDRCSVSVSWGLWFLRAAPTFGVGGALVSLASVLLMNRCFKEPCVRWQHEHTDLDPKERRAPVSLCRREYQVLAIFVCALATWATDALHRLRPVYVGLLAILVMFCPAVGPVSFDAMKGKVNFSILIFVAATITLAPVTSAEPRVADAVKSAARAVVLAADAVPVRYALLLLLAGTMSSFINIAPTVGLLTPLLCEGEALAGVALDPRLGAMLVAAAGNLAFLPFQNTPILIVASMTGDVVCPRHIVGTLALNALLTAALVVPLTLAWWAMLGWSTG